MLQMIEKKITETLLQVKETPITPWKRKRNGKPVFPEQVDENKS